MRGVGRSRSEQAKGVAMVLAIVVGALGSTLAVEGVVEAFNHEPPVLRQGDEYRYSAFLYSEMRGILGVMDDHLVVRVGQIQHVTIEGRGTVEVLPITVETRTPEWDARPRCEVRSSFGNCWEPFDELRYGNATITMYYTTSGSTLVAAHVDQSTIETNADASWAWESQLDVLTNRPDAGLERLLGQDTGPSFSVETLMQDLITLLDPRLGASLLSRFEEKTLDGRISQLGQRTNGNDTQPGEIYVCGEAGTLTGYRYDARPPSENWDDPLEEIDPMWRQQTTEAWLDLGLPMPVSIECVADYWNAENERIETVEYALRLSDVTRGPPERSAWLPPTEAAQPDLPAPSLSVAPSAGPGIPTPSGAPSDFPLEELLDQIRTHGPALDNGLRGPDGVAFGLQWARYSNTPGPEASMENAISFFAPVDPPGTERTESQETRRVTWAAIVSDHDGGVHEFMATRFVRDGLVLFEDELRYWRMDHTVGPLVEEDLGERFVTLRDILQDAEARPQAQARQSPDFYGFTMDVNNVAADSPLYADYGHRLRHEVNVTWMLSSSESSPDTRAVSVGYDARGGYAHTTTALQEAFLEDFPAPPQARPLDERPVTGGSEPDTRFAHGGPLIGMTMATLAIFALLVALAAGRRK